MNVQRCARELAKNVLDEEEGFAHSQLTMVQHAELFDVASSYVSEMMQRHINDSREQDTTPFSLADQSFILHRARGFIQRRLQKQYDMMRKERFHHLRGTAEMDLDCSIWTPVSEVLGGLYEASSLFSALTWLILLIAGTVISSLDLYHVLDVLGGLYDASTLFSVLTWLIMSIVGTVLRCLHFFLAHWQSLASELYSSIPSLRLILWWIHLVNYLSVLPPKKKKNYADDHKSVTGKERRLLMSAAMQEYERRFNEQFYAYTTTYRPDFDSDMPSALRQKFLRLVRNKLSLVQGRVVADDLRFYEMFFSVVTKTERPPPMTGTFRRLQKKEDKRILGRCFDDLLRELSSIEGCRELTATRTVFVNKSYIHLIRIRNEREDDKAELDPGFLRTQFKAIMEPYGLPPRPTKSQPHWLLPVLSTLPAILCSLVAAADGNTLLRGLIGFSACAPVGIVAAAIFDPSTISSLWLPLKNLQFLPELSCTERVRFLLLHAILCFLVAAADGNTLLRGLIGFSACAPVGIVAAAVVDPSTISSLWLLLKNLRFLPEPSWTESLQFLPAFSMLPAILCFLVVVADGNTLLDGLIGFSAWAPLGIVAAAAVDRSCATGKHFLLNLCPIVLGQPPLQPYVLKCNSTLVFFL
jgi:hypothetical protein